MTIDDEGPEPLVHSGPSSFVPALALRITLPSEIRAGAPVPIAIRVENQAAHPLDLYLRGRTIAFDVEIASVADGTVIWRRLDGAAVQAILQLRTLAAGESLTLRAEWDQRRRDGRPAAPGSYAARGRLLTDAEPLETPVATFRIVGT